MFLDTSFCVDLFREQNKLAEVAKCPASKKLKSLGDIPVYISVFVLCELEAGARLSSNPGIELKKVEDFSQLIEIVYPDTTFPRIYGEIESLLRKQGNPIPVMDLLIGISAKQYGMPIVTRDNRHFKLIPGLIVAQYI